MYSERGMCFALAVSAQEHSSNFSVQDLHASFSAEVLGSNIVNLKRVENAVNDVCSKFCQCCQWCERCMLQLLLKWCNAVGVANVAHVGSAVNGCGSKLTSQDYAGFSPWFHLPGPFWYMF